MNYPVWEAWSAGGGLVIAVIAIIHVFVAHFAVGGGLFLVLTERRARSLGDSAMLDYVRSHTRFFLLLTTVFGALTGVGIWLAISAVHPGATSLLIHNFVFGWAIEWVFFVVEIISLLIYYYAWDRLSPENHLKIGWIYFIAAWISLFVINGIITFMLTPGEWSATGSFWDGFFNPSMWPSAFFRSALAFSFAGVYGLITAVRLKDDNLRAALVRYCSMWLGLPFALLAPAAWWYFASLGDLSQSLISGGYADATGAARIFIWAAPLLLLGGLALLAKLPQSTQQVFTVALMIIGIGVMGSFEYVRETSRRPWVIHGQMYSNGLAASEIQEVRSKGVLAHARWSDIKKLEPGKEHEGAARIFRLSCSFCHSVGGIRNDIIELAVPLGAKGVEAVLADMGKGRPFMPPFSGNQAEAKALAAYLAGGLKPGK